MFESIFYSLFFVGILFLWLLATWLFFPQYFERFALMIGFAFLIPILTYGFGVSIWLTLGWINEKYSDVKSLSTCCLCFGMPFSLVVGFFIKKKLLKRKA